MCSIVWFQTHCVSEDVLELLTLLPPPPEAGNYRCTRIPQVMLHRDLNLSLLHAGEAFYKFRFVSTLDPSFLFSTFYLDMNYSVSCVQLLQYWNKTLPESSLL